jgi:hypothetical protein
MEQRISERDAQNPITDDMLTYQFVSRIRRRCRLVYSRLIGIVFKKAQGASRAPPEKRLGAMPPPSRCPAFQDFCVFTGTSKSIRIGRREAGNKIALHNV